VHRGHGPLSLAGDQAREPNSEMRCAPADLFGAEGEFLFELYSLI
jgi:hypothetical protein